MRRRTKRLLGKLLVLAFLAALGFALPYLWTVMTSDPVARKDPKSDDYAKN